MSHEGRFFTPQQEAEQTPEMSPEDFEEMMNQIPALKEMLEERVSELKNLEGEQNKDEGRMQELRAELEELQAEIAAREEVV